MSYSTHYGKRDKWEKKGRYVGWEMYRRDTQGKGLVGTQKQGKDLWRKKAEMERREGRKREKSEQVLIGERPGGECQRYLLSQRGLRCEARLSRGP